VPEDRPVADADKGFRNGIGMLSKASTQSAAK